MKGCALPFFPKTESREDTFKPNEKKKEAVKISSSEERLTGNAVKISSNKEKLTGDAVKISSSEERLTGDAVKISSNKERTTGEAMKKSSPLKPPPKEGGIKIDPFTQATFIG